MTVNPSAHLPSTGARLRLCMAPKLLATNRLDGAWWPNSKVVTDEIPPLIRAIATRFGRIRVVFLHPADWAELTLTWALPGLRAPLISWSASHDQRHLTALIRDDGRRIDLVLIPPGTEMGAARVMIDSASAPDNSLSATQTIELTMPRLKPSRRTSSVFELPR